MIDGDNGHDCFSPYHEGCDKCEGDTIQVSYCEYCCTYHKDGSEIAYKEGYTIIKENKKCNKCLMDL